jgi:hypothetical protein
VTAQGTFVIVGAGLAGAKAAEALRAQGFGGSSLSFIPFDLQFSCGAAGNRTRLSTWEYAF